MNKSFYKTPLTEQQYRFFFLKQTFSSERTLFYFHCVREMTVLSTSRPLGGSDVSVGSAGSAVRSVRSAGSAGGAPEDGADDAEKKEGDEEDEEDAENDDGNDADDGDADDGADDDDDPDDDDPDGADDEDEVDGDPDAEIDPDAEAEEDDEEMGNGDTTVPTEANNEEVGSVAVNADEHIDRVTVDAAPTPAATLTTSAVALTPAAQPPANRKRGTKGRLMYNSREIATLLVLSATMDEYREGCLKLEKARHARVYEAERRLMHMEQSILSTYRAEAEQIFREHMANRLSAARKALVDNAERIRGLERRRYGVRKNDGSDLNVGGNGGNGSTTGLGDVGNGTTGTGGGAGTSNGTGFGLSRRHDMELRGRDDKLKSEDDGGMDIGEKPRKTRKTDNKQQKVKVTVELEEQDILSDLAELRGEKRPREPDPAPTSTLHLPERKAKKKK